MTQFQTDTGNPIRTWRRAQNLTQQELADKLGIGQRLSVIEWELGYRKPNHLSLVALGRAMKISPAELTAELEKWKLEAKS